MAQRGGTPTDVIALRHPLWWSALAILLLNDHLLKGAGLVPGWLTGMRVRRRVPDAWDRLPALARASQAMPAPMGAVELRRFGSADPMPAVAP